MFTKAALGAAIILTLGMGTALAGERQIIRLHQDAPKLEHVDLGAKGPSHGDMMIFDTGFRGDRGIKGTLHGLLVTVGMGDAHEYRFGHLHFDFGDEDSIVVAGKRFFVRNQQEIPQGKAQLYAIIGGTGKFSGARGQVRTVRNANGSYDHTITLVD